MMQTAKLNKQMLIGLMTQSSCLEDINEKSNGDIEIIFFHDDLSAEDKSLRALMHKEFFSCDPFNIPPFTTCEASFFAEELLNNEEQFEIQIIHA
jgi:hypothetical protein